MHDEFKKAVLFAGIGVINTVFGLSAIYVFRIFTTSEVLANILGYCLGVCVSYYLNGKITFKAQIRDLFAFMRFILAFLIAWTTNIIIVLFMIHLEVAPQWSHLLGMPAYTVVFYLFSRFYVFRNQTKKTIQDNNV